MGVRVRGTRRVACLRGVERRLAFWRIGFGHGMTGTASLSEVHMRNRWGASILIALVLFGAGSKLEKRLTPVEMEHFTGLRVWMDAKQQKAFLKLKTEEERNAWLEERGLWERWYKFEQPMRDEILAGGVKVGWPYDALYMSWGKPHERKKMIGRSASRSVLLTYGFEVMEDGADLGWTPDSKATYKAVDKYTVLVYLDDERVGELEKKEGW